MALPEIPVWRLWPLPFAAALLPLLATLLAYTLSIRYQLAPSCLPLVDGCVSISAAARHGLPNILFRAMVLPAGVLQIFCWLLCPVWLKLIDESSTARWTGALPWLGTIAGICMIVYGSFLGTEGEGYRLMRRYGVVFYFGFTCIGMLIVSGEMQRLVRSERRHRWIGNAMLGLCLALPLLGLLHVLVPLAWPGEETRNALQNVTEWWAGVIFTLFFFVLAWAWWRSGAGLRLQLERRADRP